MNKKILTIVGLIVIAGGAAIFFLLQQGKLPISNTSLPTPPLTSISQLDETGATPEGVKTLVNANNQFAFDLYSELKKKSKNDENIFFSPYSIFVALSMTYEGAKGKTAEEMEKVLHLPADKNLRRANFAKIINEINKPNKKCKLSTANALWPRINVKLLEEYQNTIEKYYGGKMTPLDYAKDSEGSRQIINRWVEDQTEGKIKDLIPAGFLKPSTVLVLTNAIYFKGNWLFQFDPKETKEEDFKTSSGKIVKVPMMRLVNTDKKFNYAETEDVQILELPYDGKDLSMLIILPEENKLEKIENELSAEKLSEWKGMLKKQKVDIYLPRFKLKTKYFLADTLKKMGMSTAFDASANFSGINGEGGIWIDEVIHQAFVDVNEEGTEAAAATGVMMVEGIHSLFPVFRADHPFIFLIQERKTGNILFMGKVANPA
ncbi:MAG: serpin family protein, partial [Candidatus Iainarchaeum archaeon]